MPSPAAGVLVEILANEGDTVETGARVAVIDESASAVVNAGVAPSGSGDGAIAAAATPPPARSTNDELLAGLVVSPVVRRILADGGV